MFSYVVKYTFFIMNIVCIIGLSSKQGVAMTTEELADICEAMENSVQDIYVEYERYRDPPYTFEDFNEQEPKFIDLGHNKYQWYAARPFEEMCLLTSSVEVESEFGNRWYDTRTKVYNGNIGKSLISIREIDANSTRFDGVITKDKRFIPNPTMIPEYFTILRFPREPYKFTLSKILREQTEWVQVNDSIQKVGEFNVIQAYLFYDTQFKNVVGKSLYFRISFSMDHGYAPIKFEHFLPPDGKKMCTVDEVFELEQVSEGLWYPKSGRNINNHNDGTQDVFIYKASKIIVNQGLTEKDFDIIFPPGTKVSDEITNRDYVIKPTQEQLDESLPQD